MVEINTSYNPPVNGGLTNPVETQRKAFQPPDPIREIPNPAQRLEQNVPFPSPSSAVTAKTKAEVRDGPSVHHPYLGWHIDIKV